MENKFKSLDFNVIRDEVLLEDTLFNSIKNKNADNLTRLKTGTPVSAIYNVFTEITAKTNVSTQQMREISNAIKAFFILKGDDAVDEKKLARFIKQETGISATIQFISVGKQFQTGFRPGIKVESEVITLFSIDNNVSV